MLFYNERKLRTHIIPPINQTGNKNNAMSRKYPAPPPPTRHDKGATSRFLQDSEEVSPVANNNNDNGGDSACDEEIVSLCSKTTLKGSTLSVHECAEVLLPPSGSGDIHHPIHYESFYEPTMNQRCWTIRDFSTTIKYPKMLKPYKLQFDDATPPVEFWIRLTKKGTLYLQPVMKRDAVKTWGSLFLKYGFSLGPHHNFGEDFTLYSSVLQIKNLNKSHLNILDAKEIMQSYLVDGNLNLIIRYVPYFPKTQPVPDSIIELEKGLIHNCSQFSFSRNNNNVADSDDDNEDNEDNTRADYLFTTTGSDDAQANLPVQQLLLTASHFEEEISSDEDDDENSLPMYDYFTRIKSKPLRRSRKSEFLQQKRELCHHQRHHCHRHSISYSSLNPATTSVLRKNLNETM